MKEYWKKGLGHLETQLCVWKIYLCGLNMSLFIHIHMAGNEYKSKTMIDFIVNDERFRDWSLSFIGYCDIKTQLEICNHYQCKMTIASNNGNTTEKLIETLHYPPT